MRADHDSERALTADRFRRKQEEKRLARKKLQDAAPDLFAACEDARQYLSGIRIPTKERRQRRFAIVSNLEDAINKAKAKP